MLKANTTEHNQIDKSTANRHSQMHSRNMLQIEKNNKWSIYSAEHSLDMLGVATGCDSPPLSSD